MAYSVELLKRAERELGALPKKEQQRIVRALEALGGIPRPLGAKAMQGDFAGNYRIRVGKYRVIYAVEDERLLVLV